MAQLTPLDFRERGKFFRMGREPLAVDILSAIDGVEFEQAWDQRVEGVVDSTTLYFISAHHLIHAKLAAGRPQDLADAAALRQATNRQDGKTPG